MFLSNLQGLEKNGEKKLNVVQLGTLVLALLIFHFPARDRIAKKEEHTDLQILIRTLGMFNLGAIVEVLV